MFCIAYRLRYLRALIKPDSPLYMRAVDGMLIYDKDEYGRKFAQILDLETGQEKLRMENAEPYRAGNGGWLIKGDEMHFRGSKSKGEAYRQTWWCVPLTKVASRASDPAVAPGENPPP